MLKLLKNSICSFYPWGLQTAGQYCGYATNNYKDVNESSLDFKVPWDKLEVVAIARCESVKAAGTPPCKVFARNNEIVWTFTKKSTLD